MKKLKRFQIGNLTMLSQQEMMNLSGGETIFRCKTNETCNLYIHSLGITVQGRCTYYISGTSVSCYCQNGKYTTNPHSISVCFQ